ncbi:MAG TPA: hypothetical protein VJH92_00700 [Candidatus Nanoarchaeia archaeon]|nr:hypothetical protein [Candidatus Nanoarchaeia archaeon]
MNLAQSIAINIVNYLQEKGMGQNAKFDRYDPPSISIRGFYFIFNSKGKKLDIKIEPPSGEEDSFSKYFGETLRDNLLHSPEFENIAQDMNKTQYYTNKRKFYRNDQGSYHFKCEILTADSESKATSSILSHAIKPILMYKKKR